MNGLAAYAKATIAIYGQGEYGYVWGAQGQIMTKEEMARLKNLYGAGAPGGPSYYDTRAQRWLNKRAADCSGYVCNILDKLGVTGIDMTAHTIFTKCMNISKANLQPGDLTFRIKNGRAVHIGIYIGAGKVVHARGTEYGVVSTSEEEYPYWTVYGRFPHIPDIEWPDPYYKYLFEEGIKYSDKRYNDKLTRGEYFAARAKEIQAKK